MNSRRATPSIAGDYSTSLARRKPVRIPLARWGAGGPLDALALGLALRLGDGLEVRLIAPADHAFIVVLLPRSDKTAA
jgi:hypothetical protein